MISYDFDKIGVDTTIKYEKTLEPILVGDKVKFVFNDFFGEVEGVVCFQNGSFGARITKQKNNQLIGSFTPISFTWEKIEDFYSINDTFFLTRDMIHQCSTPKGGFTTAQVEFLGLSLKENWIDKAVKLRISKEQLLKFKAYGGVNSKELKKLKSMNSFFNIHNQIVQ